MTVTKWEILYDDPDISRDAAAVGYNASGEAVAFGPSRSNATEARADARERWPEATELS